MGPAICGSAGFLNYVFIGHIDWPSEAVAVASIHQEDEESTEELSG